MVAAGGQKFGIWPEKLAGLQVGASYDVDVADREYNGRTICKITKATPATAPAATNGNAVPSASTATTGDECLFVGTVLAALIGAGEVKNDKAQLYTTTKMLRGLWGATIWRRHMTGPGRLTVREALALTDRLQSRGVSRFFESQPGVAGDLITAARLLRTLLREFAAGEIIQLHGEG